MKLTACNKVNLHETTMANRYCTLPAGHKEKCRVQKKCPTCNGAGTLGYEDVEPSKLKPK